MQNNNSNIWKSIDWMTIIFYIMMIVAGWFTICGASYNFDSVGLFDFDGRPGSQLIWIGLSVFIIFVITMLDKNSLDVFAYLIYFLMILLLIATILFAPNIKGSHSWLVLGPFRIQPAEFAKFATALALAKYMGQYNFTLNSLTKYIVPLLLIFLPMLCIFLQKETGSALVFLAFFFVLYREGMSGNILLIGICAIVFFVTELKYSETVVGITQMGNMLVSLMILLISSILTINHHKKKGIVYYIGGTIAISFLIGYIVSLFVPVNYNWISLGLIAALVGYLIYLTIKHWSRVYAFIMVFTVTSLAFMHSVDYVFDNVLEPHQQIRIKVSLGLKDDPSGAGYNVNQSKIAIGSGGFTGKGFLNGTQTKLKYVPEQDTDFIFCTIGEEWGFIGSLFVLILFAGLIIRLIVLAERQHTSFARIYGYCVASIFLFHLVINIGMVLGLTPVIGIPLPFFSYGGSSLWGFTILLFIFLKMDASGKAR